MRGPRKAVDVIFVIDNSGSMSDEIAAVRDNINRDFATIVADSGLDYRVIVISRFGVDDLGVCIKPPLAQGNCEGDRASVKDTNSAVFYHYDREIGSNDAFCQILDTFDQPDAQGRAPQGWQAWLRPDAYKAFILVTDDSPKCSYRSAEFSTDFGNAGTDPFEDALHFHQALLKRSGSQFGVPPEIKYQFFSIVGLAANAVTGEPYFPHQAIVEKTCDTAPAAGPAYQSLSIITDALRYPVCEGRSFDAIFQVLARNLIQTSEAPCEFALPVLPADQLFELDSVSLEYKPGDGSDSQHFDQVAAPADCRDHSSFYITDHIRLCPTACSVVRKDTAPELEILIGCTLVPQ
jgi:hypothetical protein